MMRKLMRQRIRQLRRQSAIAGFTLLEALVVVIIIGVLFGISAPGWDAFLSRQRISTAREQLIQVIRQAQSEARTTSTARVVVFDPNPRGVPRVTQAKFPVTVTTPPNSLPVALTNLTDWKILGNGDIKAGMIALSASPAQADGTGQIVFDSTGAIAQPPTVAATQTANLRLTLVRTGTNQSGTQRCVKIATLLGALQQAEGTACDQL